MRARTGHRLRLRAALRLLRLAEAIVRLARHLAARAARPSGNDLTTLLALPACGLGRVAVKITGLVGRPPDTVALLIVRAAEGSPVAKAGLFLSGAGGAGMQASPAASSV